MKYCGFWDPVVPFCRHYTSSQDDPATLPLVQKLFLKKRSMSNKSSYLPNSLAHWLTPCLIKARYLLLPGILLMVAPESVTAADPPTPAKREETTGHLIEQLGHASFAIREKAARTLASRGIQAQKELKQALLNPDLEIRMRAHRILLKSLQSEFAARIAAFISDVDGKQEHDLPGWKQFKETMGNDRNTRQLFADMVRRESELLESFDKAINLQATFMKRLTELRPGSTTFQSSGSRQAHPATLAVVLLVVTESNIISNTSLFSQVFNLLNSSTTRQIVKGSRHNAIIMKMMSRFVLKKDIKTSSYYSVMLTLNYDMKETGLALGRRMLKTPTPSYSTTQYAAIAVARFGSAADIPLLAPHLKNVSVCHTWSNPQVQPGVIKTQVRDVVLALLIHLTKQDHKEYGFELLRTSPTTLFHTYTCGFTKEEKREAAQAKWNTWYEKNKPQ